MHSTSSFLGRSPRHLLRESYWQDDKVKKRTLANLSALPQHAIDFLKLALKNQFPRRMTPPPFVPAPPASTAPSSAPSASSSPTACSSITRRERSLALAMIVCRLLKPGTKLRVEREVGPSG